MILFIRNAQGKPTHIDRKWVGGCRIWWERGKETGCEIGAEFLLGDDENG